MPSCSQALPHSAPLGRLVPCEVPPLPLPNKCTIHDCLTSNHQDHISPSPLHPHVITSDRFTFWLSPFGIAQMNAQASIFPLKIIIHRCLIMAHCVLLGTLKNYAAGLPIFSNSAMISPYQKLNACQCLKSFS